MYNYQKYVSTSFLATALLAGVSSAFGAAPSMGTAAGFTVLAGTAVTCTAGAIVGTVGVSPGSAYTNTGCTVAGAVPPATSVSAAVARADFLNAYTALRSQNTACISMLGTTLAGENLAPGVYCLDAVAKTGVLTLTGPADGVWIFLVDGALTGTNLTVTMAGGLPCNVYWAPSAGVTLTTSVIVGRILAGDPVGGSVTFTGGTLAGQALANVAVTMTTTSLISCEVLTGSSIPGTPGTTGPGTTECHAMEHEDSDTENEREDAQAADDSTSL